MAVKLTIIIDNPKDPQAFENYYSSKEYKDRVAKIGNVLRVESAKVFPKEDGSTPPAYRTIDIYFSDYNNACAALESPETGALAAALSEAATGGLKFLLSDVES